MILVTGATGHVGRVLVDILVKSGAKVRAVSRTPWKAALPEGVEVVAADPMKPDTLEPALRGVERVFVLLHLPGEPAQAIHLARALGRSEVSQMVMFSSATVERVVRGDAIGDGHRHAEAELRKTGKPLICVRPGTLMFNSLMWAAEVRAGDVVRGIDIAPAAIMDESDVARASAAILTATSAPREAYQITGPESLSAADQVRILGEVLGRELRFESIPSAAAAQLIREHSHGAGDPFALMDNAMGPEVIWAHPNGVYEGLTGMKPRTFRQWAQAHVEAFR